MPTNPGVPLPLMPAGVLNPVDWIDGAGNMPGALQTSLMRGTPGALAWWQRKQMPETPTVAQGFPIWFHSRPYSRGAGAYAPKFGTLNINPIGAGVYAPFKLPVSGGPAARYQFGAIWFDVQTVSTSLQMSPTMPIESAAALISQSHVAAMYATTG